eukprot:503868_1
MDDEVSVSGSTYQINLTNMINNSVETIGGNPRNWDWDDVQKWLHQKGLSMMIEVFAEGATGREGTHGDELLTVTLQKLMDDSGAYRAGDKLGIYSIEEAELSPIIDRFFLELTKLQLKANAQIVTQKEAQFSDCIKMEKRIDEFKKKWDIILWIDDYIKKKTEKPSSKNISDVFNIPILSCEAHLDYWDKKNMILEKDLNDFYDDFNLQYDCVLWWSLIISKLTKYSQPIWLIFHKIAEATPGSIGIELLEIFRSDLGTMSHKELKTLTENIVIKSRYPICTALQIAYWYKCMAGIFVDRGEIYEEFAENFVEAAINYTNLIKSDYIATIILETKSDINNLSALEMGLKYKLHAFLAT